MCRRAARAAFLALCSAVRLVRMAVKTAVNGEWVHFEFWTSATASSLL